MSCCPIALVGNVLQVPSLSSWHSTSPLTRVRTCGLATVASSFTCQVQRRTMVFVQQHWHRWSTGSVFNLLFSSVFNSCWYYCGTMLSLRVTLRQIPLPPHLIEKGRGEVSPPPRWRALHSENHTPDTCYSPRVKSLLETSVRSSSLQKALLPMVTCCLFFSPILSCIQTYHG